MLKWPKIVNQVERKRVFVCIYIFLLSREGIKERVSASADIHCCGTNKILAMFFDGYMANNMAKIKFFQLSLLGR